MSVAEIGIDHHNKIPQCSVGHLVKFLYDRSHKPISIKELMEKLNIPQNYKQPFGRILKDLVHSGVIVKLKRKHFARRTNAHFITGVIQFYGKGSARVKDSKTHGETFIPKRKTGAAFSGDHVLVRISREKDHTHNKELAEGEVAYVLKRNCSTVVGTLKKKYSSYFVDPQRMNTGHTIGIENPDVAELGDRVVVQLFDQHSSRGCTRGKITEVIGPFEEPTLDTLSVIKAYDLPRYFPSDVIRQAETLAIKPSDLSDRLDLRNTFVFTVDPESAKDFDDAISLEKQGKGKWVLGVHIADVSHFVPVDSPIDREAVKRGNSIYFPDAVIPMLPEHLSNSICSLKDNVTRLTISVLITLDQKANPLNVEFRESIIRSRCRLNYLQVQSILELAKGATFPEQEFDKQDVSTIKHVHQITKKLRKARFENGALKMDLPEIQFSLGSDGRIDSITPTRHDEAHQLIEECMLLANEMVCKELTQKKISHLYRVHEKPDPEKIMELEEFLRTAGLQVGDLTLRKNLCDLLAVIADLPQAQVWNTAILRSMRKAEYSEKCIGHFGLAKQHYTHFTSPIRRYPDLVVHRILKAYLRKQKPICAKIQLLKVAQSCSERETTATQAERDVKDFKIIRYFDDQIKSGDLKEYDAVVVDVRNHGLFIHIQEVQAYGMIHKRMLGNEIFFNSMKKQFSSRGKNAKILKIGSTLKVVISRVNFKKKFLDFVPVCSRKEKNIFNKVRN